MIIHENQLITSDWHILHQNIYWQLPEERKRLTGNQFEKPSGKEAFYTAERAIYSRILEEIQMTIANNKIERFIHLGDFCFLKNNRSPIEEIQEHIPVISEIFDFLKQKGISTTMIIGNHDQPKHGAGKCVTEYFDDIVNYLWEGNNLFSHYPFGYSQVKQQVVGTSEERFFSMSKQFRRLDEALLNQWDGEPLINFHGHIHQLTYSQPLINVTYRNACIDFIDSQDVLMKGNL